MARRWICVVGFLAGVLWSMPTWASELVYTPLNPSFGGNPLNGTFLLSSAEAQNKFKEKSPSSSQDMIQDFEENLMRRILSQLANQIVADAFGTTGEGFGEGYYEFGDYVIDISTTDGTDINVNITDVGTGSSTTIEVPSYNGY